MTAEDLTDTDWQEPMPNSFKVLWDPYLQKPVQRDSPVPDNLNLRRLCKESIIELPRAFGRRTIISPKTDLRVNIGQVGGMDFFLFLLYLLFLSFLFCGHRSSLVRPAVGDRSQIGGGGEERQKCKQTSLYSTRQCNSI